MKAYEFMSLEELRFSLPEGAWIYKHTHPHGYATWHARYTTEDIYVDILRDTEAAALRDLLLRIRDAEEAMSHD